jgi:hypothetical protein
MPNRQPSLLLMSCVCLPAVSVRRSFCCIHAPLPPTHTTMHSAMHPYLPLCRRQGGRGGGQGSSGCSRGSPGPDRAAAAGRRRLRPGPGLPAAGGVRRLRPGATCVCVGWGVGGGRAWSVRVHTPWCTRHGASAAQRCPGLPKFGLRCAALPAPLIIAPRSRWQGLLVLSCLPARGYP